MGDSMRVVRLIWLVVGLAVASPAPLPLAYDLDGFDSADLVLPGAAPPIVVVEAPKPAPPPITVPAATGVSLLVSLTQQRLYLFRDGDLLATSPVSSGKRGHSTPAGHFRILEKQIHHHSNKYSNAPMPFMQRLTMGGVALHAGHLPGYPASHGCIRLPSSFAKRLYGLTRVGTPVAVIRGRPAAALLR